MFDLNGLKASFMVQTCPYVTLKLPGGSQNDEKNAEK